MLKALDKLFCYVRLHRWSAWTHKFNDDDWIVTSESTRHCQVCKIEQKVKSAEILW